MSLLPQRPLPSIKCTPHPLSQAIEDHYVAERIQALNNARQLRAKLREMRSQLEYQRLSDQVAQSSPDDGKLKMQLATRD